MKLPSVEVVLINWKRPENVARIIDALKGQSIACTITVCDCHQSSRFTLDPEVRAGIDRLHTTNHNIGAYNRYVPLGAYDHEFTYLADDDMLPGSRCLEHFLDSAAQVPFGVLGQQGRRLREHGLYVPKGVPRSDSFEEVDTLVRGYFVRTRLLSGVPRLRWELGLGQTQPVEDDILLCTAMQLYHGLPSLLTPRDPDPETLMNKEELDALHSLKDRPDHAERRRATFSLAHELGWRSVLEMRSASL